MKLLVFISIPVAALAFVYLYCSIFYDDIIDIKNVEIVEVPEKEVEINGQEWAFYTVTPYTYLSYSEMRDKLK